LSYVEDSVGFSGTKDTHWLFPLRLKLEKSPSDIINGDDGSMLHRMRCHTIDIKSIEEGDQNLWERLCIQTLKLIKSGVGCIIDAGAILVGKSF